MLQPFAWGFGISIHSPSEGRDKRNLCFRYQLSHFNPLSQRRERLILRSTATAGRRFQSTLPAKGETDGNSQLVTVARISIHSPSEGRDLFRIKRATRRNDFNPLSQRRERHVLTSLHSARAKFQSTLPAKGETNDIRVFLYQYQISIHSPSEGRDVFLFIAFYIQNYFNPLSQRRERQIIMLPCPK